MEDVRLSLYNIKLYSIAHTNQGVIMSVQVETYTVRSIWEGEKLTEQTGLDYEDAVDFYDQTEKFYLNAPDSAQASGVTVQMFRESDDHVEREITFD